MASHHRHHHEPPAGTRDLRVKGRRVTRQRELIWETFTRQPDAHLSAEDVVNQVAEELPQVNPSTVYRTLELLVAEGLLLQTNLGAERAYYELAREHAHHHLVCERCGDVLHFHDEVLGDLPKRVKSASGYTLGDGEITLYGICRNCRASA